MFTELPDGGQPDTCPELVVISDSFLQYKKMKVKSDQESAILLVVQKAKEMWPGVIIIEKSPKGEKASNGEAERAV